MELLFLTLVVEELREVIEAAALEVVRYREVLDVRAQLGFDLVIERVV